MLEKFHKNLELYGDDLNDWFQKKYDEFKLPLYGSVDVRYSGWKVSVVDANYFPAGFNNLSNDYNFELSQYFKEYILSYYENISHIHIFPEHHTRNIGYIENIIRLKKIISQAGFMVTVGSLELNGYDLLEGISEDLLLDSVSINNDDLMEIDGELPDLVLLNNDLTGGLISGLSGKIEPSKEMGWHKRKKSEHYECLEILVNEVSRILHIDPWILLPMWFVSEDKCLDLESCKIKLAKDIDSMILKIQQKYDEYDIDSKPVIFVKNNRGTYGLGIISLSSGDEINSLSNRKIKRLTYGKGGTSTEDFLIQEGIPTSLIEDDFVIEPVGYTIGGKKSFWFIRTNNTKSNIANLNSPSSVFKQLDELKTNLTNSNSFDWFNLVSKLSYLAMGLESNKK